MGKALLDNSGMNAPIDEASFETLINLCIRHIAHGLDFETYRQRIAGVVDLPGFIFPDRGADAAQARDEARAANGLARAIWKQCPHPVHRFAPAPLLVPERNGPCHCGSLRKYKQCCLPGDARVPNERMNFLPQLLEHLPKKRWAELADSRVSVDAVIDAAANWHEAGAHEDVAALLEPWFKLDRHWSARYAPLLDLLLDAYTVLHNPRKKKTLLDRALTAGDAAIRADALQRLATMAADDDNYPGAWTLFKEAQRADPESPHLAHLEVVLLISEGRESEARDRARFWLLRLGRRNDKELAQLLDLLRQIAEQGAGALVEVASSNDPQLAAFLKRWRAAPAVICHYGLEAVDGSAGPLTTKPKLERALSDWRASFGPIDYSPLRQNADDWWDDAEPWLAVLDQHPQLWSCFEVLDGLVYALAEVPIPGSSERLIRPLLERAESLLHLVLRENHADGLRLEWGWQQNRPALNLIGALIMGDMGADDPAVNIARMQWCVYTLNPDDNLGLRGQLMHTYLAQERLDEAIELSARYPDDQAEMRYNRALALFAAGHHDEAALALRAAVAVSPKVIKTLLSEAPKPVKFDGWGVRIGGAEEAWLYRQAHLELWQRYDALDWARKVAGRKTRPGETSRIG